MIRVLEFFGQDVTKSPEVLAKCFADTTADVVKDANVIGLPTGCYLGAGSEVTTANGMKARLKSDGNWVWLAKADLITRTITENGTYEAADDNADGYVEVTVNVPDPTLVTKSVTANGTYDPADDEADGYSEVTVNVPATTYDVQGTLAVESVSSFPTLVTPTSTNWSSGYANDFSVILNIPESQDPDNPLAIDGGAFKGWKGITQINIPDSVGDIGQEAFNGCTNLKAIRLPHNSQFIWIPDDCFKDCSSLISIDLPENVYDEISTDAFSGCTSLISITVRSTQRVVTISPSALDNVPNDCAIYVPAELVDAYKAASTWSDRATYIQAIPTT